MARRLTMLVFAVVAALTVLGAGDSSTTRLDRIGHELVCQCGCGQILMECNHVGCPVSAPMIDELRTQLAAQPALTESNILDTFVTKYGPIVLAAPIRGGFDIVAWIVPIAVLLLGGGVVLLVLRGWRRQTASPLATVNQAPSDEVTTRIRQDTDTL